MPSPRPLADEILDAFKHAYAGDRADVAEHLLCALETLEHEPEPSTRLADAYLTVIALKGRTPH